MFFFFQNAKYSNKFRYGNHDKNRDSPSTNSLRSSSPDSHSQSPRYHKSKNIVLSIGFQNLITFISENANSVTGQFVNKTFLLLEFMAAKRFSGRHVCCKSESVMLFDIILLIINFFQTSKINKISVYLMVCVDVMCTL